MDTKQKARKRKGERKDNRIQVTYTDGYRQDGKPNRISFYGKTRKEAEEKRNAYKARLSAGVVSNNITVAEWIDTCLSQYRQRVNKAYVKNDAVPYNRLKKAIGSMKVTDVREVTLQECLNAVEGMSDSTIKKYHQAICKVFEKARKNRIIADDPAEFLEPPNGTKGSHRALERWESECIMNNWDQHRAGIWAMLMLLCGLRRGEMMALRWENIDMDNKQLTVCEVAVVETNKTTIEERAKSIAGIRTLPICAPLWDALNKTPAEKRSGLVCLSAQGDQISESAFERGWSGFCLAMQRILNDEDPIQQGRRKKLEDKIKEANEQGKEYKLFNVRAHDLRHTFATALYDAGVPVKAAQYYLGHADIRMTLDLYTHLSQEREKASRSQLVTFLDGWLKLEAPET